LMQICHLGHNKRWFQPDTPFFGETVSLARIWDCLKPNRFSPEIYSTYKTDDLILYLLCLATIRIFRSIRMPSRDGPTMTSPE